MTSFTARDGAGRVLDSATPGTLRPFLDACLRDGAGYVVLTRTGRETPDRRQASATEPDQMRADTANGGWTLEVRSPGTPSRAGRAPNTDAAFDILRSWAADDGWWAEAFSWRPLGQE